MRNLFSKLPVERLSALASQLKRRGRAVAEHKYFKRILGSNLAFVLIASSIIPAGPAQAIAETPKEEAIVSVADTLKDSLKTNVKIHYPVEKVVINQGYSFFHPGTDFGANIGDTVYPMEAGKVTQAGRDFTGYGNRVIVEHENGFETLYAHLSKIEVAVGDQVDPFTEIGKVGITGRTTGPHLHFEIRKGGITLNPFSILPRIN